MSFSRDINLVIRFDLNHQRLNTLCIENCLLRKGHGTKIYQI
jgi:hypothetical protein